MNIRNLVFLKREVKKFKDVLVNAAKEKDQQLELHMGVFAFVSCVIRRQKS
jgi:hypothetical protein